MEEDEIIEILRKTGAFLTGHFALASYFHSKDYINKDAVYPHPMDISKLGLEIAERFIDDDVEVVVGPEKGGIILSQWVAYHLTVLLGHEVFSVFAEKIVDHIGTKKDFEFNRGYDTIVAGRRVLVVEDILTTGGSVERVIALVRSIGGNVVGLGALCNRGNVTSSNIGDVPKFVALVNIELPKWRPDKCPLCAQGIPINTDVGKGKEFLEQQEK